MIIGTPAAYIQRDFYGGNIPAGSRFASYQKAAMTPSAGTISPVVVAFWVAAAVGFIAWLIWG